MRKYIDSTFVEKKEQEEITRAAEQTIKDI